MFQHLPNAKLILLPDSGHGVLYAASFMQEGLRVLGD
jgi:hypothetical protein